MAEAIARYDAADVIEPRSAGLSPLGSVADLTKQTLVKNGYSADGLTSDAMTPEAFHAAEMVINMTGRPIADAIPEYEKVEDWMVQDPYGCDPDIYQRVFESIKRRVGQLALDLRDKRQHKKPAQ